VIIIGKNSKPEGSSKGGGQGIFLSVSGIMVLSGKK
jgi:hypothetical protein